MLVEKPPKKQRLVITVEKPPHSSICKPVAFKIQKKAKDYFFSHTFMQTFLNEDARRRMLHAGELCSISEKKRAPRTKLEQLGSTSAAMLCLEESRTFAPEIYSHKLLFNNS